MLKDKALMEAVKLEAVYIAARFSRRPEANRLARQLMERGHKVTSRWVKPDTDHVLPTGSSEQAADAERRRFAMEDCDDVRACDWLISLMEEPRSNGRGGRHIEFGMALGLGKRLSIIGPRETVFHHLDEVEHFETVEELLAVPPRTTPANLPEADNQEALAGEGVEGLVERLWDALAHETGMTKFGRSTVVTHGEFVAAVAPLLPARTLPSNEALAGDDRSGVEGIDGRRLMDLANEVVRAATNLCEDTDQTGTTSASSGDTIVYAVPIESSDRLNAALDALTEALPSNEQPVPARALALVQDALSRTPSSPQADVADVERVARVVALRERARPFIEARKSNRPIGNGERVVGFILPEDVAGLSNGLFMLDALIELSTMTTRPAGPIPMLLFCPACGLKHVDEPDPDGVTSVEISGRESRWDNPPHRSHLCHGCGAIWRPADVPTNGVACIGTTGKADTVNLNEVSSTTRPAGREEVEDDEDHNPDGFQHASPEVERVIGDAARQHLAALSKEGEEAAWRWRYVPLDGEPGPWIIRHTPLKPRGPDNAGGSIEVQPLYALSPLPVSGEVAGALADVAAERRRQVEAEGWTLGHDDRHDDGDLADAAACYAVSRQIVVVEEFQNVPISRGLWPWDAEWWKPKSRREDLIRAGALIVAEIERLDRRAALTPQQATEEG